MQTFFFYDLETSGVNPRTARIMQFAGQRTDLKLNPVGDPVNVTIKLTPDVIPEPDAILVTGITPQKTLQDGITEAEFLRIFTDEVAIPGTVFVGFNTVRFDDEFMRFLHYRNFYDPYEWQWKDDRGRWDLLDVVRMTRALRPDGIKWPFDSEGKPTNRLELLTDINGLDHVNAHDAMSDVHASIALAKLLQEKQPKLFEYLMGMRDKKKVRKLVESANPFVYSSGKYESRFEKTSVAQYIAKHPKHQGALVYDLRYDPKKYADMPPEKLVEEWKWKRETNGFRLPVKTLQYNRCPAVAPLGVLDAASQKRLEIDLKTIEKHRQALAGMTKFVENLLEALAIMDKQQQTSWLAAPKDVDAQLYDGFIENADRNVERAVRAADPTELSDFADKLHDPRLKALLPLYKARNYSDTLTPEERASWDQHCAEVLLGGGESSRLAKFFKRLGELAESPGLADEKRYLLEELQIYGQSIMPITDDLSA